MTEALADRYGAVVLSYISANGECTTPDIASWLGLDRFQTLRLLNVMHERGRLSRWKPSGNARPTHWNLAVHIARPVKQNELDEAAIDNAWLKHPTKTRAQVARMLRA